MYTFCWCVLTHIDLTLEPPVLLLFFIKAEYFVKKIKAELCMHGCEKIVICCTNDNSCWSGKIIFARQIVRMCHSDKMARDLRTSKKGTMAEAINGAKETIPSKIARTDDGKVVTVVLGTQWGDEGKGKVVDMLATKADICCRCQVSWFSSGQWWRNTRWLGNTRWLLQRGPGSKSRSHTSMYENVCV